jgi:hypothetical protein
VALNESPYDECGIHGYDFDDDCGWCFVLSGPEQGAPRQAEDEQEDTTVRQTAYGHEALSPLGIAVRVGTLVPSGPAVRIEVDDIARWLEPEEAHALASALNEAATYAVHEDRAARRG